MIDPETEYLLARAKDEAVLAIQSGHPAAADAHQAMAVRYANRAMSELADHGPARPGVPGPSSRPRLP